MSYSLAYPEEEPNIYTRISFYEYQRIRPNEANPKLTLRGTVRLPMPTALPDNYGVRLSSFDSDLAGFLFSSNVGSNAAAAGQEILERLRNNPGGSAAISDLAKTALGIAPGISDTSLGRIAQLSVGAVKNPHTTTIFEGVNLRTHNFNFKMSAKNQNEANQIRRIIEQIKLEMHPKVALGGLSLEYPSLVKIDFEGDVYVTPVYYSFIQTFTPNYTPVAGPTFYKDGTPVSIEIALSIQEINILTRDSIQGTAVDNSGVESALGSAVTQSRQGAPVTTNDGRLAGRV